MYFGLNNARVVELQDYLNKGIIINEKDIETFFPNECKILFESSIKQFWSECVSMNYTLKAKERKISWILKKKPMMR